MRVRALTGLAMTALGAATLAGCASSGGVTAGGASTGGSSPSSSTSTSPSPTSPAGVIPTGAPPAAGVTVTVSGTVVQGAEPSCLILRSDQGELELLSHKESVHSGDHVTATGHVVHVMSHCMQGEPFEVDHLTVDTSAG